LLINTLKTVDVHPSQAFHSVDEYLPYKRAAGKAADDEKRIYGEREIL
jgi:hypothetical protein